MIENSLEAIAQIRLGDRKRLAKSDKLDHVHRKLIFDQNVLFNPMYKALLNKSFTNQQIQLFYSEYYYGSIRGFLSEVMHLTLKHYDNNYWIEYIKAIRKEESRPKSHVILFEEFLKSVNVALLDAQFPSQNFIKQSKVGYTKNLPYSCGYALAVEVEADYQIYVVSEFTRQIFGRKTVDENIWFDVHLDEKGEEEHANMTINLAESCVKTDEDYQEFIAGFIQSCKDTENYMLEVCKLLNFSS